MLAVVLLGELAAENGELLESRRKQRVERDRPEAVGGEDVVLVDFEFLEHLELAPVKLLQAMSAVSSSSRSVGIETLLLTLR